MSEPEQVYIPPGMSVTPVPSGFTQPAPFSSSSFSGLASVPDIEDLTENTGELIPAGADDLFDDQPLQVKLPPPKPPSESFYKLDKRLQNLDTTITYDGCMLPDGSRRHWDLWGPGAGRQGLMLAPGVSGLMHLPFTQLMSEGPYQIGAIPERIDWRKRELSMAVMVNVGYGPDTSFRYRMLEERWWQSWSARDEGYLGVFTRTHGWRFIKVRLAEEPKTPFQLDPTTNDNNFMQWDCSVVAVDPFWKKRKEIVKWSNIVEGGEPPGTPWWQIEQFMRDLIRGLIPGFSNLVPGLHVGEGIIPVWNRGDQAAHPLFIVSSPGKAWIQDGPDGRMVECPLLTSQDGYVLIDTDPIKRTATATTDPVDPIFMRIVRNSQLLDFLLHDITSQTLPVWRRMSGFFQVPWPPREQAQIRVRHSSPYGSITCLMPQHYGMGFA